jgi:hypothetical protein
MPLVLTTYSSLGVIAGLVYPMQAGLCLRDRLQSDLYLAVPQRHPRLLNPPLIGAERYALEIEAFHYSP